MDGLIVRKKYPKVMKRKILSGVLMVVVIAVTSLLWRFQTMGQPGSERFPAASQSLDRDKEAGPHSRQSTDADSRSEVPETRHPARERMPKDQRSALERAVAVQEKFVEEKRAALAQFVRSNGIIYNGTDRPKEEVLDKTTKRVNEVGGYADLKRAYDVELQNLERMKTKLDAL